MDDKILSDMIAVLGSAVKYQKWEDNLVFRQWVDIKEAVTNLDKLVKKYKECTFSISDMQEIFRACEYANRYIVIRDVSFSICTRDEKKHGSYEGTHFPAIKYFEEFIKEVNSKNEKRIYEVLATEKHSLEIKLG